MQRKESKTSQKITANALFWTCFGALLVCVPLRLVQLFINIEPHTGFFKAIDWTVYTVYSAVIVALVLLASLAFASKRIPASRPVFRKSPMLVFSGFFFALGLAMDAALSITKTIRAFTEVSITKEVLAQVLFTDGIFSVLLRTICAIAACVYFVLIALSYASEKATYCDYKLLALSPLFWALFKMVERFMTKISFLEVSELIFELIYLAFMSLFFLSFARVSSQVGQKGEMKKVVRYGMLAGFMALFISVTRLACVAGGRGELIASGFPFSIADLGFGIFTLSYIYLHMQYGRPASEDDEITAEPEEESKPSKELDETFLEEA